MKTNIFINLIRSCPFLPKNLKGKLLVLSRFLKPDEKRDMEATFRESTERHAAVVKEGIRQMKSVKKSIRREVRSEKEKKERLEEQRNIPNFDDATT